MRFENSYTAIIEMENIPMTDHDTTPHHDERSCKDLLEWLSDYIDGDLKEELYEKIKNHASHCKPCVAFIQTLQKTAELIQTKPGIDVPPEAMAELTVSLQQCKNEMKKA
ncbi:MAG TPA: zf-HC2 domain-containing protein [Nitrospirales bacterium]|nr:zf-HC2 domain-containing protein [Nitrospirales bacterium]